MSFFRATTAATQSISASTETVLTFGTEISDPDSVFASNNFTVPSGWNGRVGSLSAGFRSGTAENRMSLRIQKQTGGSGSFVTIAAFEHAGGQSISVSAHPVIFSTGDVYRVAYFGGSTTKENNAQNFFAGYVFPAVTKLGMFRVVNNATQNVNSLNASAVNLGSEQIDSHSFFASGVVTVPAAFDGGFLDMTAGLNRAATSGYVLLYIQRSTDSGASWTSIAESMDETDSGGLINLSSGPLPATTGHQYRLMIFPRSSFTIPNDPTTFFAGAFFKY